MMGRCGDFACCCDWRCCYTAVALTAMPRIELEIDEDALKLRFPQGWLDSHPLTLADLEQEADYLRAAGVKLKFK
jgi:hypothetical protein